MTQSTTTPTQNQLDQLASPKALIKYKNVFLGYNKRPILGDVNIEVMAGDYIGIIGPNGSGKSTFLKSILGLLSPLKGNITIAGTTINKATKNRMGYIPQNIQIEKDFPLSTYDAVMQGRYGLIGMFKRPRPEDHEAVKYALHQVHMGKYRDRPIGHLSGGEQQKIMIARALARKPDILLLDEPTSALDYSMTQSVFRLVKELHEKYHLTVLMVHHNINLIRKNCQRLLIFDGAIRYDGPPHDVEADNIIKKAYNL